jgi:hypothetical protein
MKKLLFLIAVIFILTSCGVETPNIGCKGKEVFVVNQITLNADGTCCYREEKLNNPFAQFFAMKSEFNAPKGLFQIGDTVTFTIPPKANNQ